MKLSGMYSWIISALIITKSPTVECPALTDSADMADLYAGQKKRTGEAAPNVMPLFARLENPYMATAEDKARVRAGGRAAADQFTADLIAQGYDGVIYQVAPDAKEIVVFDPAAVKSQFNDGTWSDAQDLLRQGELKDRKSTRLNSSHSQQSRMPSSA